MKNMITSNAGNSFSAQYTGSLDFTINFDSMDSVTIQSSSLLTNTFTGSVNNLDFGTMSSIDFDFSLLSVNTKLTMNDLGITDLSLVTASIVSSADAIEVNTLQPVNTGDIVTLLHGSTIELTSPIITIDIYDYYYGLKETELTDQEEIDTLRYQGCRSDEVTNILTNTIRLNEYFQYSLDPELETDIDPQVYETMQYYYDAYLIGEGTTEVDLIAANDEAFVQAIKDSIQATLNDASLVIDEGALNIEVSNSIVTDSDIDATNQTAAVGFTLG